jgi:DNA-binding GntR family transcriptional regulator
MAIQSRGRGGVNVETAAAAGGAVNHRRSLVDDVYDRLIELLMQEDVEPGSRLPIDALARAWGVSQTPIREAMARAEEAGLVVKEQLRGFTVAPPLTADEFAQLIAMRLLIEPYCAAKACENVDDQLISTLDHHTAVMRDAPKGPTAHDYQEYMRADFAFHEAIAAASGNRFLQVALAVAGTHAHRFRRFIGGTVTDADETICEHSSVLAALRSRDAEAAGIAMRQHLLGVQDRGHPESQSDR